MSLLPSSLSLARRVLAAEGWRGVRDRALDRRAEALRRRSFRPAAREDLSGGVAVPVLLLAATPPAPRLGGVQAQLLARLEACPADSPWALLYPEAGGYRLEVAASGNRRSSSWAAERWTGFEPLADAAFERIVEEAAGLLGAHLLQVEGIAGLPLGSLGALARRIPTIVALHDFAAFCPRPHLYEEPRGRFCGYCREAARCQVCLAASWPGLPASFQEERRRAAAGLLEAAEAVVYPSDFLYRAHGELFPLLDPARQHVIPPALAFRSPRRRTTTAVPPRTVAYVGSAKPHKGAGIFAEIVARLSLELPGVRFQAYGGGDPDLLARFRELGVSVRGYYRHGTLPELLARDRVGLAVLPSIVPESYGLTADECAAASVPVLAFEIGALGERLPPWSRVPLAAGAEGMAGRIRQILVERGGPAGGSFRGTSPREACEAFHSLYERLAP